MPGEHIGHQLGYPTANLEPEDGRKLIPASGVYAVWAQLEGEQQLRAAMMNIGSRPTFDGHRQTLEVNILVSRLWFVCAKNGVLILLRHLWLSWRWIRNK